MFEKEAEERAFEKYPVPIKGDSIFLERNLKYEEGFKDGAEFGYNKANEWHYVKDGDLPPKKLEGKPILVRVRRYAEEWFIAYYMLDGYNRKNGKRFYADTDQEFSINIKDVIAWKEVVLPKEEENAKSDN